MAPVFQASATQRKQAEESKQQTLPERLLHNLGPENLLPVQVHRAVAIPHLVWPRVSGKIFGFT